MARPVYGTDQPTAKTRIKEAFWQLLSSSSYGQITVKRLCAAAQVNPNTFYYHFESMDDLALDALNDEKLYEIPTFISDKVLMQNPNALSEALEYIAIDERWQRIRLFVSSDSTILRQHFYDTMEQFWLSLIGVQKEELAETDYLDFSFILHGAMAIIDRQTEQYSLAFIKSLPQRALGQGIIQTLENLVLKYKQQTISREF